MLLEIRLISLKEESGRTGTGLMPRQGHPWGKRNSSTFQHKMYFQTPKLIVTEIKSVENLLPRQI